MPDNYGEQLARRPGEEFRPEASERTGEVDLGVDELITVTSGIPESAPVKAVQPESQEPVAEPLPKMPQRAAKQSTTKRKFDAGELANLESLRAHIEDL